jgi:hypothetical protein
LRGRSARPVDFGGDGVKVRLRHGIGGGGGGEEL